MLQLLARSKSMLTRAPTFKESAHTSTQHAVARKDPPATHWCIVYELLLKHLLTNYAHTLVYAGDITIIVKHYCGLEQLVTDISAWLYPNGMQFRPSKTRVYRFNKPQS